MWLLESAWRDGVQWGVQDALEPPVGSARLKDAARGDERGSCPPPQLHPPSANAKIPENGGVLKVRGKQVLGGWGAGGETPYPLFHNCPYSNGDGGSVLYSGVFWMEWSCFLVYLKLLI